MKIGKEDKDSDVINHLIIGRTGGNKVKRKQINWIKLE
jgi:hypothetical protein